MKYDNLKFINIINLDQTMKNNKPINYMFDNKLKQINKFYITQ